MLGDGMQQKDDFRHSLECAHPNTEPGQKCNLCGKWIPLKEESKENEIHKPIQKDTGT